MRGVLDVGQAKIGLIFVQQGEFLGLPSPFDFSGFKPEYSELLKVGLVVLDQLTEVLMLDTQLLGDQAGIDAGFVVDFDQGDDVVHNGLLVEQGAATSLVTARVTD